MLLREAIMRLPLRERIILAVIIEIIKVKERVLSIPPVK